MSAQVDELRELLGRRFPATVPLAHGTTATVATGIDTLDRALPEGGLPRGRLVVWAPGGGATGMLRSACVAVVARGERAAWVDGAGLVTGEAWDGPVAGVGACRGIVELLRPDGPVSALSSAEELLRSGGFGLVVLTGGIGDVADPAGRLETSGRRGNVVRGAGARADGTSGSGESTLLAGSAAGVRLSRAAREGGGAFVWLREGSEPVAGLRLRSCVPADGYHWRRNPFGEPTVVESVKVRVSVSGLGLGREVEFEMVVEQHDLRMSLEPALVDRRGAGS